MSMPRNLRTTVARHAVGYAIGTACLIADGLTGPAFTIAWLAILIVIVGGWIRTMVEADNES